MNKSLLSLLFAGLAATVPASAATDFVPTFTANFNTNFGSNAVAAQNAWIAAAATFSSIFNDNIKINITVDGVAGTGTLGASNTFINSISYPSLYNAVLGDATSADDATATGAGGSLGGSGTLNSATDPLAPTPTHNWWVTTAQEKALGLIAGNTAGSDGTTTFGAGFAYTFSGAIVGGTYDFQGVALHEISEIMGRIGLSGGLVNSAPGYTLLDAYSFSGAGVRNLGPGANANFSLSDGTLMLMAFNNKTSLGGDSRDWASGTNDAFNAFSSSGVANGLTAVDIRLMDALGYNLTSATPEPSSIALMSAGLLGLFYARRRRVR